MKNRRDDIERYIRGEMTPAEMHALEKEALTDPFLAEALEGLEQAGSADNFLQDLHKLNRSIHQRTHERKDKTLKMWWWTAGMAAAVLFVAASGFLVISILKDQRAQQLAMETKMPEELALPSGKDSLTVIMPVESASRERSYVVNERPVGRNERGSETERADTPPADVEKAVSPLAENYSEVEETTDAPEDVVAETAVEDDAEALAKTAPPDEREINAKSSEDAAGKKIASRATQSRAESGASATRQPDTGGPVITGRVTDEADGQGLPGVNVQVKGTAIGTVTDADGKYEITLPNPNATLVFNFIGFEAHEVPVNKGGEVNVSMTVDATSLSEVVVIGYSTRSERDVDDTYHAAAPEGGTSAFKQYLSKAISYPEKAMDTKTEGRVVVRFTVEADGKLTNFEVVRSIGAGCDEELIRAIKEGPAWKPSRRGSTPLRDKVTVRHRFRLSEK